MRTRSIPEIPFVVVPCLLLFVLACLFLTVTGHGDHISLFFHQSAALIHALDRQKNLFFFSFLIGYTVFWFIYAQSRQEPLTRQKALRKSTQITALLAFTGMATPLLGFLTQYVYFTMPS